MSSLDYLILKLFGFFLRLKNLLSLPAFFERKENFFEILVSIEIELKRSLVHSMANFYSEFPQSRCTELQLKMRLAGHKMIGRDFIATRLGENNSYILFAR
jgi:hypothetical protein